MIIIIIHLQQQQKQNVNIQLTTFTEEIKSNINAVHHCQAQTGYPNCLLYTRIAIGNIPQISYDLNLKKEKKNTHKDNNNQLPILCNICNKLKDTIFNQLEKSSKLQRNKIIN